MVAPRKAHAHPAQLSAKGRESGPNLLQNFAEWIARQQTGRQRQPTINSAPSRSIPRQACCFAAEDQHDAGRTGKPRFPDRPRRFRREEVRIAERWKLALEVIPTRPHAQVDVRPIIQTGTLYFLIVEAEAEWLDEMERRSGRQTGAPGVAGIPVDFGVHKHDVCCVAQTSTNVIAHVAQ